MASFQRSGDITNLVSGATTANSINNVVWVNDVTQLAAAISSDTHIMIPPGVTITNPTISLDGIDRLTISGGGDSSVITASGDAFTLGDTTFFTLKNVKIIGAGTGITDTASKSGTDISIENVSFTIANPIHMDQATTVHTRHRISGCRFTGASGQDIIYSVGITDSIISGCTSTGNTDTSAAIELGVTTRCTVSDCNIVKGTGTYTIRVGAGASEGIIISNCALSGATTTSHIRLETSEGTILSNNVCTGSVNGIDAISTSNNVTVTGNMCKDNTTSQIDVNGDNCVVIGNQCRGNSANGIRVGPDSNNTLVVGNKCEGTSATGLSIVSGAANTVVIGNDFSGSTTAEVTDNGTATQNAGPVGKNNFTATTNPAVTDDIDLGYLVGSRWVNVSTDNEFVCLDNTDGAAVWTITTAGATSLKDEGGAIAGAPHTSINYVGSAITVADATGGEATVTVTGDFTGGTVAVGTEATLGTFHTLDVNRNFTLTSGAGSGSQLRIKGTINSEATINDNLYGEILSNIAFGTNDSSAITHNFVTDLAILQSTLTSANSNTTVTNLASLYIQNAPATAGSPIITNGPYAIFADAGNVRFDGNLEIADKAIRFASSGGSQYFTSGVSAFEPIVFAQTGTTTDEYTFGTAAMLGKSGSASLPGYSFVSDPDTGMYREDVDEIGFATAGVKRVVIGGAATGEPVLLATASTAVGTQQIQLQSTFSGANEAFSLLAIERQANTTGNGVGISFNMGDTPGGVTANQNYAYIGGMITDPDASQSGALTFRPVTTGTEAEMMRLDGTGLRIGSTGAATDTLDVDGSANISGDLTVGEVGSGGTLEFDVATTTLSVNTGSAGLASLDLVTDGAHDCTLATGNSFSFLAATGAIQFHPSSNMTFGSPSNATVRISDIGVKINPGASVVMSDSVGALEVVSGSASINLGNDAGTGAINIGTGAAARTITIGNVTGATSVNVNTGSGGFSISGELLADDGIVTAPAYSFTTSTGTGIWSSTTDTLNFSTAGAEVMEINSTGNVTIGTIGSNVNYGLRVSKVINQASGNLHTLLIGGAITSTGTGNLIGFQVGESSGTNYTIGAGTTTNVARMSLASFNPTASGAGTITNAANVIVNNVVVNNEGGNVPTVTNLATLLIEAPPTSTGTVTNGPYSIQVKSGDTVLGGSLKVGSGIGTISDTLDVDGTANISGAVTLGTALTVANGGTGATTLTSDSILTGNGTSAVVAESNLTFNSNNNLALTGNFSLGDTPAFQGPQYGIYLDRTQTLSSTSGVPSGIHVDINYTTGPSGGPTSDAASIHILAPVFTQNVVAITNTASLLIDGPPTGTATGTAENHSLFIKSGSTKLGGDLIIQGASTTASTGFDAGATIDPTDAVVMFTLTADRTPTLDNGKYIGQTITLIQDSGAFKVTITPTTTGGFTSLILDGVNDYFTLIWAGTSSVQARWKGMGGNLSGSLAAFNA